jgi:flagellar basal-body rod protein FlgG
MMRALWTAASGMTSQQLNVDTISNNLANVNTTAYKKESLEFKSLLYQTLRTADQDGANAAGSPINLQVGLGVRPVATARDFSAGSFQRTDRQLDVAIEGQGFFSVQRGDAVVYTKDGSFKLSPTDEGLMIVTSEGYPILDTDDAPIIIPNENITIEDGGAIYFVNADGELEDSGQLVSLTQFPNPQGLTATGQNLYAPTAAAGAPELEADGNVARLSRIVQGVVEMSNVLVADEMVKMIVAQRAYELNSKAIQTSDDMLNTANNLRR